MTQQMVALVTGGSSGIGRATALAMAAAGARVVIGDRDAVGGGETAEAIARAGGEALFVEADMTDPVAVKALLPCVGCVTATTVRPAFAGPLRLSGSVSLANTSMALLLLSSFTVALSSTASGVSLRVLMVRLTVAVSVWPESAVPLSLIV